jgi:hypothetical protein
VRCSPVFNRVKTDYRGTACLACLGGRHVHGLHLNRHRIPYDLGRIPARFFLLQD